MSGVHAFADPGLGNTSYLVDLGSGLAAAVDPPRDVDAHLERADRLGLRIVAACETHLHADFVSGARELAEATGADVLANRDAGLAYRHRGASDGETIRLGDVELSVLFTPGHTPEHIAYVLQKDGSPTDVFTGGALISGGAARTDLIAPERTEELARAQFRSVRRLVELPADVVVRPTHGGGSFCAAASTDPAGTIGDQLAANPLLAHLDEDAFVEALMSGYGSFPPYFLRLREVNRRGPTLVRDLDAPRALGPVEVAELGAVLVDARPISEWAEEHPVGAVSIAYRDAFATWLGWIVPFGTPIVLLARTEDLDDIVRAARRIGYDGVLGWVDGGIAAWRRAGLETRSAEIVDAEGARLLAEAHTPFLDVRQDAEVRQGRIRGASHVELGALKNDGSVPDSEVVVYCGHGERAATAASLIEGRARPVVLDGGIGAWLAAGLPSDR